MDYITKIYSTRLNRKNFFIGLLLFFIIWPLVLEFIQQLFNEIGEYSPVVQWMPLTLSVAMLFSLLIRRLHDVNKTGYHLLLMFLPFINFLVLYWLASKGTIGSNQYGNEDKENSMRSIFLGQG